MIGSPSSVAVAPLAALSVSSNLPRADSAYAQEAAVVFTIAWYARQGSLRRLGQGGSGVGTFTPGTTGRTMLDGIVLENAIDVVPLGTVSSRLWRARARFSESAALLQRRMEVENP